MNNFKTGDWIYYVDSLGETCPTVVQAVKKNKVKIENLNFKNVWVNASNCSLQCEDEQATDLDRCDKAKKITMSSMSLKDKKKSLKQLGFKIERLNVGYGFDAGYVYKKGKVAFSNSRNCTGWFYS